jgi:hypothetical protein
VNIPHKNPPNWTIGGNDGVFSYVQDHCAFVDRLVLSLTAEWNPRLKEGVRTTGNPPIGGSGRLYSRALNGFCKITGNRFQVKYGSFNRFKRVPPIRLVLYSTKVLLTGSDVTRIAKSLFRHITKAHVGELEMAFDLSPSGDFSCAQEIFTSARRIREFTDKYGRQTLYAGSRTSGWQFKKYDKRPTVSRFEFTFRRSFLRKQRIISPHHVRRLSRFDLSQLVSFRSIFKADLAAALAHMKDGWRKQDLVNWPRRRSLQDLARILKRRGINPELLFHECVTERRIQRMQRQLIF